MLLATAVTLFVGRDYLCGGSIVVSIIIPFIAAILIVIVWRQYEKQRTKEFKQVAEEMGSIFYPKGDDMQFRCSPKGVPERSGICCTAARNSLKLGFSAISIRPVAAKVVIRYGRALSIFAHQS